MYYHPVAMALVMFLGCSLSVMQALSSSSLLPSSKQRTATTVTRRPQYPQRRQAYSAYSTLSAALDNNNNTSNSSKTQDRTVVSQKSVAACVLTAALWIAPVVFEQSPVVPHHRIAFHHTAAAKELTPQQDRTTTIYEHNTQAFIGGYTVTGTKRSLTPHNNNNKSPKPPTTEAFTVAQECICSVTATPHGIFGTGANLDNAFLFLATVTHNHKGKQDWTAEQTSVGVTPAYTATMRFGETAGGRHTAIGATRGGGGGGQ